MTSTCEQPQTGGTCRELHEPERWCAPCLLADQQRLTGLVADLQDTIGYVDLHIKSRWVTTKLTTPQKDLWADACDAWITRLYADDPDTLADDSGFDRWWRDPDGPAAARPDLA